MWDVSAFVGDWPFRRLPATEPEALAARLRTEGVERACVSALDGLFSGDPQPANEYWAGRLKALPFFRFVAVINPALPGWEGALAASQERLGAAGVRLHPNYHGYALDGESVHALMRAAAARALPVFLSLRMQVRRSMHPLASVSDIVACDALALCRAHPETTIVLAGAKWGEMQELRPLLADLPRVYLELSHLEWVDGVHRFVRQWGAERLLWGTHAPLFTPTAARLKVETARLSAAERHALVSGNAEQLWQGAP